MADATEKKLSAIIVFCVVAIQAVGLSQELTTSNARNNDGINHYTLIQQMADEIDRGGNPLDFWSPEMSLGIPMVRTYQPLAHIVVVGAYLGMAKKVPLMTVFAIIRFLWFLALPLSLYAGMRLLEFRPLTAAAGALLLPLIAARDTGLLGIEMRSWMVRGVYPQLVATNLMLLAIGLGFQAVRKGKHVTIAGVALGLTTLAQFMYGWMGAASVCLIALLPTATVPLMARLRRTVAIGAVAAILSAFQLIPLYTDGWLINHSRNEEPIKFESYGAQKVLSWLFSGQLLDDNRIPIFSLIALVGAAVLAWRFWKTRKLTDNELLVACSCLLWLLLFFGRTTWGPLMLLFGIGAEFHISRLIGILQIFLLMLAAIGLDTMWRQIGIRWNAVAAGILTGIILWPLVAERAAWVEANEQEGMETVAAISANQSALEQAVAIARQRGGRVYAGFPQTYAYAPNFMLGKMPVFGETILRLLPTVSYSYNVSVLTADVIAHFNELRPAHYPVFNIKTTLAPPTGALPPYLSSLGDSGMFRVAAAPGTGYFGLVDVGARMKVDRHTSYWGNVPWLKSDWPEKKLYLRLDFNYDAKNELPALRRGDPFPDLPAATSDPGTVTNERQTGQVYEADIDVARPAYAIFRMTYHFLWHAYLDGVAQRTTMLSPGFVGLPVTPGRHHLVCRYEPGKWKLALAAAGMAICAALVIGEGLVAKRRAGAKT